MARHQQGVHGNFSGKIGNVVGASWKGKGIMRIRPASVSNPRTDQQQTVRGKFALIGRFTARFSSFIAVGFKAYALGMTTQNAAMMYNLKYGISGAYPDLVMNMSALKLSMGDLPLPPNLSVVKSGTALQLSWTDNSSEPGATSTDLLFIGIYDAEKEKALKYEGIFQRAQTNGSIEVPSMWLQSNLHVFVFLKSQTHKSGNPFCVSESIYLGSIDMTS